MQRCAYCGQRVVGDGFQLDDEVFCSQDCLEDFDSGSLEEFGIDGNYDEDYGDYRDV